MHQKHVLDDATRIERADDGRGDGDGHRASQAARNEDLRRIGILHHAAAARRSSVLSLTRSGTMMGATLFTAISRVSDTVEFTRIAAVFE